MKNYRIICYWPSEDWAVQERIEKDDHTTDWMEAHRCTPTHGRSFQRDKKRIEPMKLPKAPKAGHCSEERSLISPDYARNFICDFILGKEQKNTQLQLF